MVHEIDARIYLGTACVMDSARSGYPRLTCASIVTDFSCRVKEQCLSKKEDRGLIGNTCIS